MTYLRRIWLLTVRRPKHSLRMFFMVFVFSMLGCAGNFFGNIVGSYQSMLLHDIGYKLALYREDGEEIPSRLIREINGLDSVAGCDMEMYSLVRPVNFKNAVKEDEKDVFDAPQSETVRLFGNLDTALNPRFSGNMHMEEGRIPDSGNPGALIDSYLAEENGIGIGDEVEIADPDTDKQGKIPVIGIYTMIRFPQEEQDSGENIVYSRSPYSYVFCDLQSYEEALGIEGSGSGISIYAQNMQELDRAYQEVMAMDLPAEVYELENESRNQIERGTLTSYRVLKSAASTLVSISMSVALLVLFFVTIVWMRDSYRDIAVQISLGQGRGSIILQYFIQVSVIAVLALLLSLPAGMIFVSKCGGGLVRGALAASGTLNSADMDGYLLSAIGQNMPLRAYIQSGAGYLAAAWLSVGVSAAGVLACRPRDLFHVR